MIDAADKATADAERAMEIFERQLQERHVAPQGAFTRVTEINCVDCGEIIPEARLKAMPRTHRCALCAADVERR